ncbi:flavin-containing monooxygenase [Neopusillimonas aromaticivorans]|uniref:flavin-containing monooxygenase n=1 Tax=Neopusillimonas aromaticivorans TaxID=2979868 RepID=UPI00259A7DEE|nr:NAD(P)/FAD-dependent oxidoreductase [Neopusillimonas aromaticivorans]WJJ93010.1 NAD(P)/FAD-dependent oxidoreductase [Neopusillimonas aromaticivorans]
MKIAIIGAGFAGLSSAKVLTQFGHDVTVFEKAPDVGGVWSVTRRYPGLKTQNNKDTYFLSDFPMPAEYPEWPSGEQVQRYLAAFAKHFDLDRRINLNTEVLSADQDGDKSWRIKTRNVKTGAETEHHFDNLVVANGIFSEPFIPPYPGREEFVAAGGQLMATSDFHNLEDARGKNVLVVGYGKSSCDVAAVIGEVAASTKVIARELLWKMPRKLLNVLNYKFLMLTRMGEALFPWIELKGFEKFLHGAGSGVRDGMLASVQKIATRQLKLDKLGLIPEGTFERIARSTVSLATDELYDQVARGTTEVARECEITSLGARDGKPVATLSDGRTVPADMVICGTGFKQVVPFFSEQLQAQLTDDRGNFELYRQVKPISVPKLHFCGYNSSFYSPLSAEAAALWIAADLMGAIDLPPPDQRRVMVQRRLRWMEERTEGKHARGTNIIPFSMHNIDEILNEIGYNVSAFKRFKQWLTPVDARDYRVITHKLLERQKQMQASPARFVKAAH